jgi:hypothetical protein
MKYLALAMLLIVMQASPPVQQKATNSPGTTNQASAPPQPAAGVTNQASPKNQLSDPDRTDTGVERKVQITRLPTDHSIWIFNALLIIVGGLQAYYLWRTMQAIQRQATSMAEQKDSLDRSVAAAQSSADAANSNIDLIVNEKRARIFVEVDPLVLSGTQQVSNVVNYKIIFHCPTFAFIGDTRAEFIVSDSSNPPDPHDGFPYRISIPPTISPRETTEPQHSFLLRVLDSFEIEQIEHKKSFIHFVGFIKYKDFMGRERETTFCHTWHPRPSNRLVIGPAGWQKSGPPEANRET